MSHLVRSLQEVQDIPGVTIVGGGHREPDHEEDYGPRPQEGDPEDVGQTGGVPGVLGGRGSGGGVCGGRYA